VTGKLSSYLRQSVRVLLTALLTVAILLPPTALPVAAASGDRTIHLHYTHTGETGSFTFRRGGRYDDRVLKQLNVFLADWRTKEPAKMDPALFDLLWSVYQEVGGRQPIHVVSSYRSPKTNAMLRAKSSGVAENSQHTKGKAIDFFIPGVNLTRLREVAMRHQVGGVGYYPTSGSPFVHLDTGNVRAWPRMTRAQLKKVFPDGRTLHLPTDGKPLSAEGRRYAEAEWKKCRTVPCNGRMPAATTRLASVEAPVPASKPRTLMDVFFGDGKQQQPRPQQPASVQLASLSEPTQRTVSTIEIAAPVPAPPLRAADGSVQAAGPVPFPAQKSSRLLLATRAALPAANEETALTALAALEVPVPQPRVLMTDGGSAELVTAYAPESAAGGGPQLDLRQIIEAGDSSLPAIAGAPDPRLVLDRDNIKTASLGSPPPAVGGDIFDRTFSALRGSTTPAPMAAALAELVASRQPDDSISTREVALVAPEIDHVTETLVHPVLVSSQHFAVMTEAEGYLDKSTELGPLTGRMAFGTASQQPVAHDRFVSSRPLLVAAR
jgi:uncharacterized protein YcbK (DUF882 family)